MAEGNGGAERRLREIVDGLGLGIFRTEFNPEKGDTALTEIGDALLGIYDIDRREDMLGKSPAVFYVRDADRQEVIDRLKRYGSIRNAEYEYVTAKGRHFWGSLSAVVRKGEDGRMFIDGIVEDITVRHEAEEQAREIRERMDSLMNSLSVGVFSHIFDPNGTFGEVNDALVRMTEADSREQLATMKLGDFYVDDRQRSDFGRKLMESGFVKGEEMEMRTVKGRKMWVAITAAVRKDKYGTPHIDGIVEDITDRRAAEAFRRRQLEIGQSLAQAAYGYIGSGDYERLIGSVLKEAGELLQADRVCIARLSGDGSRLVYEHEWMKEGLRSLAGVMAEVPSERMAWSVGRIRAGEAVTINSLADLPKEAVFEREISESAGLQAMLAVPLALRPGDGEGAVLVSRYGRPGPWSQSEIDSAQLIANLLAGAISRQESESKLTESRRQMEEIMSHVNLALFRTGGPPDWPIMDLNDAAAAMLFGGDRRAALGRPFARVFSKNDGLLANLTKEGHLSRERVRVNSLSGREFWAEISGRLSRDRDGQEYFGGVLSDIDRLLQTEAKADELDSLKNTFIQVVSNQVRSPLKSLSWSLETLMSEDLGKLNEAQKDFLRVISGAEKEILARLNDLLTALDIEENRVVFRKTSFSLDSVWNSVMPDISRRCRLKGIALKYDPPKEAMNVKADAEKIREAIVVLAENAVDYTPADGQVSVSLERSGGSIVFRVKDTGVGIPESERERIFSRFFRATNASMMKPEATGLALAIAKYYIEQHGGRVGFESKEGQGSTFWFEIPAA